MAKNGKGQQGKKNQEKEEISWVFGEFDSAEEINQAARGLMQEGDDQMLRKLAEENGLSEEAEMYISGETEELCDPVSAALGKLEIERAHENNPLIDDVADYLSANCDDIQFAKAVRKKGKRIKKAADRIAKEAMKHTATIAGRSCHYCGPMRGYQLVREYYIKG